jgi:hypothetical protein
MYGRRKLYELRVLFACTRSSLIVLWHRHVQYIRAFMKLHHAFHILTVAQELDCYKLWHDMCSSSWNSRKRRVGFWDVETLTFSGQISVRFTAPHASRSLPQEKFLVLISFISWEIVQLKNPVNSSGIEPATFCPLRQWRDSIFLHLASLTT